MPIVKHHTFAHAAPAFIPSSRFPCPYELDNCLLITNSDPVAFLDEFAGSVSRITHILVVHANVTPHVSERSDDNVQVLVRLIF